MIEIAPGSLNHLSLVGTKEEPTKEEGLVKVIRTTIKSRNLTHLDLVPYRSVRKHLIGDLNATASTGLLAYIDPAEHRLILVKARKDQWYDKPVIRPTKDLSDDVRIQVTLGFEMPSGLYRAELTSYTSEPGLEPMPAIILQPNYPKLTFFEKLRAMFSIEP